MTNRCIFSYLYVNMRYTRLLFLLSIVAIGFSSCNKNTVARTKPAMTGKWKHNDSKKKKTHIVIGGDSRGWIEIHYDKSVANEITTKKWFIHNGELRFGRTPERDEIFTINVEPLTASSTIINKFDTVKPGQRYMILNKSIFVEF